MNICAKEIPKTQGKNAIAGYLLVENKLEINHSNYRAAGARNYNIALNCSGTPLKQFGQSRPFSVFFNAYLVLKLNSFNM